MKDFPLFATEHGAASLILKEIPYKKIAYIKILDSQEPIELVKECASFCRICGAESIYASGHPALERYPYQLSILTMRGSLPDYSGKMACLWPVTEENVKSWRELYNQKMAAVDHAATMEHGDEKRIVDAIGTYFIHDATDILGIGWVEDNEILAVGSVKPRAGETILNTLQSLVPDTFLQLDVASTNQKAISLYERLGFVKVAEKSVWYTIENAENV